MVTRRGPQRSALPYQVLAGVEPTPGGWLVAVGNLQGITLAPQPAMVLPTLADVLDYRPGFDVIALHSPVGSPAKPGEERRCDVAARELLGRARAGAALPAPARSLLDAPSFEEAQLLDWSMTVNRWRIMPRAAESIREVQSWRQRNVWEVNPELAFRQMNEGRLVAHGRRTQHGRQERMALLERKLPGCDRALEQRPRRVRENHLLDALADLWIARRIVARAIARLADPPEWDPEGVRMDIVF